MYRPSSELYTLEVTLSPVFIRKSNTKIGNLVLRKFQEDLINNLAVKKDKILVIDIPTGGGKTITLLSPLLMYYLDYCEFDCPKSVIGIYPSKDLAADQFSNITKLIDAIGDVKELDPSECEVPVNTNNIRCIEVRHNKKQRKVFIFLLTSETLTEIINEFKKRSDEDVLRFRFLSFMASLISGRPDIFTIVLTVPEYLYLTVLGVYAQRSINEETGYAAIKLLYKLLRNNVDLIEETRKIVLESIQVSRGTINAIRNIVSQLFGDILFIDEAHLYSSEQLPMLLLLIYMYFTYGGPSSYWGKNVIVSSATMNKELLEGLKKVAEALKIDDPTIIGSTDIIYGVPDRQDEYHMLRKPTKVILVGISASLPPLTEHLYSQNMLPVVISYFEKDIKKAIKNNVKVGVLTDRLTIVKRAAGVLRKILNDTPYCYTSDRKILPEYVCKIPTKGSEDKLRVLVGSQSASYGIDIPGLDFLIVFAKDIPTLIQRIGRSGRHKEGDSIAKVIIITSRKIVRNLERDLKDTTHLPYNEFFEIYLPRNGYPRNIGIFGKDIWLSTLRALIVLLQFSIINGIAYKDIFDVKPHKVLSSIKPFINKVISDEHRKIIKTILEKSIQHITPETVTRITSLRLIFSVDLSSLIEPEKESKISFMTLLRTYSLTQFKRITSKTYIDPLAYGKYELVIVSSEPERMEAIKYEIIPINVLTDIDPSIKIIQYDVEQNISIIRPLINVIEQLHIDKKTPIIYVPTKSPKYALASYFYLNAIPVIKPVEYKTKTYYKLIENNIIGILLIL